VEQQDTPVPYCRLGLFQSIEIPDDLVAAGLSKWPRLWRKPELQAPDAYHLNHSLAVTLKHFHPPVGIS
jgi:hypothetical protein